MKWLSKFFSKGKKKEENNRSFEMADSTSPTQDLNNESEEEMLDKVAKQINKYGMQLPSTILLEGVKPLAFIGGQMSTVFVTPFLECMGIRVDNWATLFSKKENIDRLLKKIEESKNNL